MMNLSIVSAAASGIDWGERVSTATTVTLMGMVTIFAVLAILWGMIEIMHVLLHRGEKSKKAASKQAPASPAPAVSAADDAAIAAAIAASLAAAEDDGATVAAITAAISAMRAEEGNTGDFRVVSFKRVGRAYGRRK